jgi:hypothetical protein
LLLQIGYRGLDDPDDLVALELKAALQREIRVVPVLVEGQSCPQRQELPESLAKLNRPGIRLCWRIQVAGRGWASRASREVQLPVVATPVSQASTRTRLMASAVSTCCRWVLARPR